MSAFVLSTPVCILDYGTTLDPAVVHAYQGSPSPLRINSGADYQNQFETGDDGAWAPAVIGHTPNTSLLGPNGYAGPFTQESVTFTASGLRAHTSVTLAFDSYAIGGWNGDEWDVDVVGGPRLLSSGFSNGTTPQSYPDSLGAGTHPARTGATAKDALSSGSTDSVYHHRFTFTHSDSTLSVGFRAPTLLPGGSASWGIDNVEVVLDDAQICSGPASQALRFAGAQFVSVADSASLRPQDVTLEARASFGVQTDPHPAIVSKTVGPGAADSYVLWYQGGSLWGTTGEVAVSYNWQPAIGRWYHLVYSYDHASNKQALYVDGKRVAIGDARAVPIAYDNHPVLIGNDINSESGQFSFFVGDIDEVRIWGVARSATDIAYSAMTCTSDTQGLLGYWHFDEASGQIVNDASGNGNIGQLGSTAGPDSSDPVRVPRSRP